MNKKKWEKIKHQISFADSKARESSNYLNVFLEGNLVYEDLIKYISFDIEKANQAIEYYIKALAMIGMHYDDIEKESDEELRRITSERKKDGGIVKYGHKLTDFFTSQEFNDIPKNLRTFILMEFLDSLYKGESSTEEYKETLENATNKFFENSNLGFPDDAIMDELYNMVEPIFVQEIEDRKLNNAYVQSRYNFNREDDKKIINTRFCHKLIGTLQNTIKLYLNYNKQKCVFLEGHRKHIFVDYNSIYKYISLNGSSKVFFCNKEGITTIKSFDEGFHLNLKPPYYDVYYYNQGNPVLLHYDEILRDSITYNDKSYILNKDQETQKTR